MIQRIAAIGDVHACVSEFKRLYNNLCWLSLDEIWCLGDLVDRGPDSAGVIDLCIKNNIKSVMGNHCESIIGHYERRLKDPNYQPKNLDKKETLSQLKDHHYAYLKSLPYLHVIDDLGLILVHAGVWPKIPLYAQSSSVCRISLIHPDYPGATRWFNEDMKGIKEEEHYKNGWRRWYKVYDHKQDIIFGHNTFNQPMIYQSKLGGKCIGIDTGSSFGGCLTACIYDQSKQPWFISEKNDKVYCKSTTRHFWEAQ